MSCYFDNSLKNKYNLANQQIVKKTGKAFESKRKNIIEN